MSRNGSSLIERLARITPGVPALARYRFATDFRHDLVAGISVAVVALPVAVAYAQLAGRRWKPTAAKPARPMRRPTRNNRTCCPTNETQQDQYRPPPSPP